MIAKQIVDFRYGKRWDFRMEGGCRAAPSHRSQDIADVAAYVGKLERAGSAVSAAASSSRKAAAYTRSNARRATARAEGNAQRGVPRLAGQHYGYLMRQMYDAVDGRRPALPRLHSQRIEPLDFQQVRAVSDYLARIGWHAGAETASPQTP